MIQVEAHSEFLMGHSPDSQENSYQAEDKLDTKRHMNLALLLQYPRDHVPVMTIKLTLGSYHYISLYVYALPFHWSHMPYST
jgi:hypothetical protein